VNTQPAKKAGGFRLWLKAGSICHPADFIHQPPIPGRAPVLPHIDTKTRIKANL
jgi:hypothetical protein